MVVGSFTAFRAYQSLVDWWANTKYAPVRSRRISIKSHPNHTLDRRRTIGVLYISARNLLPECSILYCVSFTKKCRNITQSVYGVVGQLCIHISSRACSISQYAACWLYTLTVGKRRNSLTKKILRHESAPALSIRFACRYLSYIYNTCGAQNNLRNLNITPRLHSRTQYLNQHTGYRALVFLRG